MLSEPFRIVQISDIHLCADTEGSLLGVKTLESFRAVLELLRKEKQPPHFILLTGDLSQDGSESSYRRVAEEISTFQLPVFYIPGNHDNSQIMTQIYPQAMISTQKQLVLDGWQFILLDSHIQGKVEGFLEASELDFLEHSLKMYPNHRAIIVFHHHPIPVGSVWLDNLGLKNSGEMWELLTRYPQVHTIFFGHVHQQHEGEKNTIQYYSPPSTCIQFKPGCKDFALDELPPGYRMIELYPNGDLKTRIERVSHYVGVFQKDAKGY